MQWSVLQDIVQLSLELHSFLVDVIRTEVAVFQRRSLAQETTPHAVQPAFPNETTSYAVEPALADETAADRVETTLVRREGVHLENAM